MAYGNLETYTKNQVPAALEGDAGVFRTGSQWGGPGGINCGWHRDTRDLWRGDSPWGNNIEKVK